MYFLVNVDLSGMLVVFDDEMLNFLLQNYLLLESLNFFNKVLVCKVLVNCIF